MNNYQEQQELNDEATRWDYNQEAFGGSEEPPEYVPTNGEVMETLAYEHKKYRHDEIVEHCPLCESDEPEYVGYEGRRPNKPPEHRTEHRIVKSRSMANDSWLIVCSCGREWQSWRWLAEENFNEHKG